MWLSVSHSSLKILLSLFIDQQLLSIRGGATLSEIRVLLQYQYTCACSHQTRQGNTTAPTETAHFLFSSSYIHCYMYMSYMYRHIVHSLLLCRLVHITPQILPTILFQYSHFLCRLFPIFHLLFPWILPIIPMDFTYYSHGFHLLFPWILPIIPIPQTIGNM